MKRILFRKVQAALDAAAGAIANDQDMEFHDPALTHDEAVGGLKALADVVKQLGLSPEKIVAAQEFVKTPVSVEFVPQTAGSANEAGKRRVLAPGWDPHAKSGA